MTPRGNGSSDPGQMKPTGLPGSRIEGGTGMREPIAPLTSCPAWKALEAHYRKIRELHLRTLFAGDPARGERMAAEAAGIYFDYSKNRITDETLTLLLQLAQESGLRSRIDAMFGGEKINVTEKRAVLHVALRAPRGQAIVRGRRGRDAPGARRPRPDGRLRHRRAQRGVEGPHGQGDPQRRQHRHRRLRPRPGHGVRGAEATTANRDLTSAFRLQRRRHPHRRGDARSRSGRDAVHRRVEDVHHAGDDDQRAHARATGASAALGDQRPSPSTSSRSRRTRRRWRSSASTPATCSSSGTGSADATRSGRRSGCPSMIAIGPEKFLELLDGLHAMDEHFRTAPFEQNLPVMLALLGVWYNNFFGAQTARHPAVRPVPAALPGLLPAGRHGEQRQAVTATAQRSSYQTGPDRLGRAGHQRPARLLPADPPGDASSIPCDFIGFAPAATTRSAGHHDVLMANFFAQTEALAFGKTAEEVRGGTPHWLVPAPHVRGQPPDQRSSCWTG